MRRLPSTTAAALAVAVLASSLAAPTRAAHTLAPTCRLPTA